MKNKKINKLLSNFVTIILLFSLVTPTFATTKPATNMHLFKTNSQELTANKISEKLTTEFDSKKYVTYLIKMAEQTDVATISKNSLKNSIAKKDTQIKAKLTTRNAVINSLRETSTRTQASLINYLDDMKASGKVKDYKSFYIVNTMAITSTKEVMENIAKRNEVAKILPNQTIYLDGNPSSSKSADKTTLKDNHSQSESKSTSSADPGDPNVTWDINLVDAPKVWKEGIDGTGIIIGSLDTGVDYTHQALYRKWRGLDANGKASNPGLSWYDATDQHSILPYDDIGHGTHTMGIMVGSEENGTHKIGVAPGAKWISAKVFDFFGQTTDQELLDAGQWMLAPKDAQGNLHPEMAPDVINNSWGGPGMDEFYRGMVQAWKAANIVPVFSAGNTNTPSKAEPGSVANPANYPESFAVGATDKDNILAFFSLRGPSPYGEIKPDVSAPGVNVLSSYPGGLYMEESGTSMAGPIVAGIAALMLQENASLTVDQLEKIIKETATPMTNEDYASSPNNGYGYGIVNAYNSFKALTSGLGTVTGKVTTPGEDKEKPVIDYTPIKLAFTNDDIPLKVTVSDNINIGTVEAFARKTGDQEWTPIDMKETSGDYKHGDFEGVIPATFVTKAGIEYYFKVTDFGNNVVTTDINSIQVSDGMTPGYFQDFENNFDGFRIEGKNSTWQWGAPTRGPESAFSGSKVVGTNLSGAYYPNSSADLILPTFDLTNTTKRVMLSFKQWYDLEPYKDFATVYAKSISTNNQWVQIGDYITGFNGGWQTQRIDLSSFLGQQVQVKLELTSDDTVQKLGWYIDDLSLDTDQTPPAAPSNLTGYSDPLGHIHLKWDAPKDDDLDHYNIYRSSTPGSGYESIGSSTTTDFEDWDPASSPGSYYYVVTAVDSSLNESVYSNEVSEKPETNPKAIFKDNFDGPDDNGWTHSGTNDEWERGTPQGGPSGPYSAPNVWGTDLDGNYEDNSDYSLYSPVIDLTNTIHPIVAFQDWFQIQNYNYGTPPDRVSFEISSDGGTSWTKFQDFASLYGNSWWQDAFSLEDYKGKQVQFRFHLISDGAKNYAGFYLDNFQVLDVSAQTAASLATHNRHVLETINSKTKIEKTSHAFSNQSVSTPKEATVADTVQGLPLTNSTVTLLETGQSVVSDPRNGDFKINASPGTYTARAEAYGYYPEDQTITIKNNETATSNFSLKPIPHGLIQGVIRDQKTGKPISNARVMVMEDARVSPVYTDSNGAYTLDVLAGDYTLSASAPDFFDQEVKVSVSGGQTTTKEVSLKSFNGQSGELGYDDGSMESSLAFNNAGAIQAVLMTPSTNTVEVTGAKFMFFGEQFPAPGGTDFKYALYDASGPNGAPGKIIAGPLKGTALRDGNWTTVHFDTGIMVHGNFYIAEIQTSDFPFCPGLGNDIDGTYNGRGWINIDGTWQKSVPQQGNLMIHALVKDEVNAPIITSPANKTFTNQANTTITGTSSANGAKVKLYNGSDMIGTGTVENGKFSIPITLNDGKNNITAVCEVEGKDTDPSDMLTITLDQNAPILFVSNPVDGIKTNINVVTVNGSASDGNLGSLTINDLPVKVNGDGTFSYPVVVNSGENTITIKATDSAGNVSVITRKVFVDQTAPVLSNITPSKNVYLKSGEAVKVSFDSEPGLNAGFRIELPLLLMSKNASSANGISIKETQPGHYEGTWTTPKDFKVTGAIIIVYASDSAGNYEETQAVGRITVDSNLSPKAVMLISGGTRVKDKKPLTFDGTRSYDPDGRIVDYTWRFGDGSTSKSPKVTHRYKQSGKYYVTLIVTDNKGAKNSITRRIIISK